jgi:mono/diheme cytochrome c family protein
VPDMQPALAGSAIVAGDPSTLGRLLIHGPDAVLPKTRARYENEMPAFDTLSDEEIAAVMAYVRREHGGKSEPITPAQAKAWRAS